MRKINQEMKRKPLLRIGLVVLFAVGLLLPCFRMGSEGGGIPAWVKTTEENSSHHSSHHDSDRHHDDSDREDRCCHEGIAYASYGVQSQGDVLTPPIARPWVKIPLSWILSTEFPSATLLLYHHRIPTSSYFRSFLSPEIFLFNSALLI